MGDAALLVVRADIPLQQGLRQFVVIDNTFLRSLSERIFHYNKD